MKILSHKLFILITLLLAVSACRDEDFFPVMETISSDSGNNSTRAELTNPGALQQEGDYWVAKGQVPLVGVGRVADDISSALVSVLNSSDTKLDYMFDEDLTNCAEIKGEAIGIDLLANQGIAVKDVYRTYAGGQTVGFAIKQENSGVLTLDVLKTFFIETYLDGNKQESIGATTGTDVLDLNLLSPKNASVQAVSCVTSKPFDEIKLCFGGVSASVLSGLKIYYAFVGENPEIPIVKSTFTNASAEGEGLIHKGDLLNDDLTDGPGFGIIEIGSNSYKVNFGNIPSVPVNSEIGFNTSSGGLLGLGLFNNTQLIYTYSDNSTEAVTLDGGVLGVSLIGGGHNAYGAIPPQSKNVKAVEIKFSTALNLDLNWTTVHYAYYRTPVKIDPTAYFAVGNDTISTNSYTLPLPKDDKGSVAYVFEGGPSNAAITGNKLTGMTIDGSFRVSAVYTAPDGQQTAYNFVIVRKTQEMPACHTAITQKLYPQARTLPVDEFTGCLLCIEDAQIDGSHLAGNLVDANTNNYAGGVGGLQLAGNIGIVAVDAGQTIGRVGEMRVGFVLQTAKEFLDLGALQFFRIRVLDENKNEVANGVPYENEGVGLGLLGSDGSKIRYSIKVDKPFRYVELYNADVATLDLSALRVYYAFWEDVADKNCSDILSSGIPGEACISMISSAQNNADIYYEETKTPNVAGVESTFAGLSNVIDNNTNTSAVVPVSVQLGGATTLGIKFNTLTKGQAVGILLRKPSGLADVNLITQGVGMTVYNGTSKVEVEEDTEGSVGVLGLKVLGFGDRIYLEATPKGDFDRVVLSFTTGVLTALTSYEVFGVYYRPDTDGDGIPDCSEDPDEGSEGVELGLQASDICVGDAMAVTAVEGIGTVPGSSYWLKCVSDDNEVIIPVRIEGSMLVTVDSNRPLMITVSGIYALRLYNAETCGEENLVSSNALILTVHPEETTWTGDRSSDWNTWDNWTDGTPWDCTNVIIPGPGDVTRFPILTQSSYQNGMNRCNYIHIKDGGQLVNSFYLNSYNKAWVNLNLTGGRYYMLSAPLKDMVSGDMFISPGMTPASFTQLTEQTYKEVRTNPYIYQRLWSTYAPVKNPAGYEASGTVSPDETNWTPPYNALSQKYEAGQGFSLMAGKVTGTTYEFVFPKMHQTYHYYSLSGSPTGMTESVHPDRSVSGRFIYEGAWKNNALTVTLTNQKEGLAFLAGNPFMAHIDLKTFMAFNNIKEVKVYDGTVNNSLILIDGELVSSTGSALNYVMPMEAFFVMNATAVPSLTVTFTPSMLSAGASRTRALSRAALASAGVGNGMLRISASAEGSVSSCLLRVSDKAGAAVRQGEDTRLLMDSETRPKAVVYTVADQTALDIQQIPSSVGRIPLGFYLAREGMNVTLSFDYAGSAWSGCVIVDSRTGTRTAISAGKVTLNNVNSGSGVYYLERK